MCLFFKFSYFNLLVPCFVLLYTFILSVSSLCYVSDGGQGRLSGGLVREGVGGVKTLATSVLTLNICTVCQNGLTHVSMKSSC